MLPLVYVGGQPGFSVWIGLLVPPAPVQPLAGVQAPFWQHLNLL